MTWQHGALGRDGDADFSATVSEQRLESVPCSSPGLGLVLCQLRLCMVVSPMYPAGTRSAGALRTGVCCALEPAAPAEPDLWLHPDPSRSWPSAPHQPSGDWAESLSLQGGH